LDQTGLVAKIFSGATNIYEGRNNLSTDSFEHEGRIFYKKGIAISLDTFKKVQITADPQTMILIELTFLQQELQFCDEADTSTHNSLIQAIQSFEDALRCLKTVDVSSHYKYVETSYPMASKQRYHGFPRDAVHLACKSHHTRLQNSLRTPGINMIEKAVLTQRVSNMATIQAAYLEKQKKALKIN